MSDYVQLLHFQQSSEGYCLPTCARMVLAYLGKETSEDIVNQALGVQEYGTPSFAIQRLITLGVRVIYREWSVPQLLESLRSDSPVIIFVRTAFLDHWNEDVAHAVVVVGAVENQRFWIHDPVQPTGPIEVSWDGLLAGWAEFSYRGAAITL